MRRGADKIGAGAASMLEAGDSATIYRFHRTGDKLEETCCVGVESG